MADISVKQFLESRGADPSKGIRCLALGTASLRCLINPGLRNPLLGYAFELESFDIRNTRSLHNDTDLVCVSLKIDDRMLPVFTRSMGDVNNGNYALNLVISPATEILPGSNVVFSYVILNNSASSVDLAILQDALDILADIVGDGINVILGSIGLIGSAIAEVLNILISLGTARCDGIVAIDKIPFTGADLANLTQNGTFHNRLDYPGNLDPNSEGYKEVYNSQSGCGSNSDYSVNWSISRFMLPSVPALSTDRNPFALANLQKGKDLVVFTVDKYGWLWQKAHCAAGGWPGFVNLAAPPGVVVAGPACATAAPSGYSGVFVIGKNGNLFELHQDHETSWSWIDHHSPPGEQGTGSPGVVAGPSGYIGAFVVTAQGHLWELPFLNGWQNWKFHQWPGNTIIADTGLSAVIDSSGQVRVFVAGRDGNLYQYRSGDASWLNHGPPPGTSPAGSPSFVATSSDYVGGLVLGVNRHIYELSATDGATFSWKDHGAPPHTSEDLTQVGLGPGSPSLIAGPDGYLGALVVGNNGDLNELYRADDGSWQWVSIGPPPPGTVPRIASSDPSYAAGTSGYRGGFVNGADGCLYEIYHTGNHNWAWRAHNE